MLHRVVVTGLGAVSPLGLDVASLWSGLLEGRSGIGPITRFDATGYPVTFAGEVKGFEPERWIEPKEVKKLDRVLQFGIAAAQMALDDAALTIDDAIADEVAVCIGSGIGGIETLCAAIDTLRELGHRKVSPFIVPKLLINMASGQVSIHTGARGANLSHVSACATGNHSIGEAFRLIQRGEAVAAIAGGTEAPIAPLGVAGFARMRALSTRNEAPAAACRPFDRDRDGFVMAEGAGIVVLEQLDHALARGARIHCEIAGYAATSDAYHMTTPDPGGRGAARCMQRAMRDAGWAPESVQYINAHGTGTEYNDAIETRAIRSVFGAHADALCISSTKSMTGHLLGAAGGLEAVICAKVLRDAVVPPTINLKTPDPECDLDYVAEGARAVPVDRVLSNAFGFGGTNACLAFARWSDG